MNVVSFKNDEFYVSYLEQVSELGKALDSICHLGGRPEPRDLPETALCIREANPGFFSGALFLILYGDHREAYEKLVPDLGRCIEYFMANLDKIGHSSDMPKMKEVN